MMDNNNTKKDRVYLRIDPKKHTPAEILKIMQATRRAIRKADGLPVEDEDDDGSE